MLRAQPIGKQTLWFPIKFGLALLKKRTNFSSILVPVVLDYLVNKSTATVTMQILKIPYKIMYIENYWCWNHNTKIATSFIPNSQWHDPRSFYLINK